MAVGYSELESMRLTYPAKIINLLLDDRKDDLLPDDDIFAAVNGNVGIIIRHKLSRRYSDQFTAWETEPHEMVELISDQLTIYEYYARKGRTPPGKIAKEYKQAMQLLQDIADGKADLEGATQDESSSKIWSTNKKPTMSLDERDRDTGTLIKRGTLHHF
jgi:phage gp36-like protein